MSNYKREEKGDNTEGNNKAPTYKLQHDIESSSDLKGTLEEMMLDAKIEFTLRETLIVAKKGFHELIINVIKMKRQIIVETLTVRALDSLVTKDEDDEIISVFPSRCRSMGISNQTKENEVIYC